MSSKAICNAVSELERYIIREILLPRIEALPDTESYKEEARAFYLSLMDNKKALDQISAKTCGLIYQTFCGYNKDILDDVMGDIISATIQDKTNDYRKVKKSTHGFWRDKFDLNPKTSSFSVSFTNVCFRAMQTSAKMIESRKKHEQNDFVLSSEKGEEISYISTVGDNRDTELTEELMTGYDTVINEMHDFVLNGTGLDDAAKMIFKVWFDKKEEKLDFSVPVRMSSEIYPVVQKLMIESGQKPFSPVSLHVRWKQVQERIRQFFD